MRGEMLRWSQPETETPPRGQVDYCPSSLSSCSASSSAIASRSRSRLTARFVELIARLRAPGGCPWDREQTHETVKPMTIEEAYEVAHAIDEGDDDELEGELGDLLLQVVFQDEGVSDIDLLEIVVDRLRGRDEWGQLQRALETLRECGG